MNLEEKAVKKDNITYDSKKLKFLEGKTQQKLFFFKKEIIRALKRVKRFEFQKTSKRIRNMRSINDETSLHRLEEELLIIKNLDLNPIGDFLLYIRCLKESELFQILNLKEVDSPLKNVSECIKNVITRVFNSNIVKRCIERTIFSLKRIAKIQDETMKLKKLKKNKENFIDKESSAISDQSKEQTVNSGLLNKKKKDKNTLIPKKKSKFKNNNHISLSKSKENQEKLEKKLKSMSGSVFLPTLSAGYISGTDDESNIESEYQAIDKPRRNRRGQRARRKIWEKKYGKNARHIQAMNLQTQQRIQSLKKKAKTPHNTKNIDLNDKRNEKITPLHSSWEAARRLKSKQSINIKFEGTKTKFE
ncbi:uncharacterized protein T551_01157 [Pneumocystis jirovecii RU7]|uniref:Bud22 domain-containing protein n=1 Tax=Pneumocystis jirovecii (strain RU7) TaxID=1408657 RepID=A0A0W4ZU59_PNEJ7|nr:uncharacterized protein T551_01157 [Pneumocystis jirovecii RU7]KTW31896.1 hypothetical protein T551_01157 [Pneumocystis jirovecii RU7]